jgi:DNA-binding HxlR family transcriptional regulator
MPSSSPNAARDCACPVMAFQRMISGKYKARIIWDLNDRPLRYGELRRGLLRGAENGRAVTARVLSRELKTLAEMGLIARKDFGAVPPKVEYRLTKLGRSFLPVIESIQDWGIRYFQPALLTISKN